MDPVFLPGSCRDLVTAVSYLLGHHPGDSLVAITLNEDRATAAVRFPLPAGPDHVRAGLTALLDHRDMTAVVLAAYGDTLAAATEALAAGIAVAEQHAAPVAHLVWAGEGVYATSLCTPACPTGGHPIASVREVDVDGCVTSRRVTCRTISELLTTLTPDHEPEPGSEGGSVSAAFGAELARLAHLLATDPDTAIDRIHTEAAGLLDEHAATGALTAEKTAQMLLALAHPRVVEHAWMLTDHYGPAATIGTWSHLARHAPPRHTAAAAALLGFAAWRTGDRGLARTAVHDALTEQPGLLLARFVDALLSEDIPADTLPRIDLARLHPASTGHDTATPVAA